MTITKEKEFKKGDRVEWDSHGGTAVGTQVERKITERTEARRPDGRRLGGRAAVPREEREVRRDRRPQARGAAASRLSYMRNTP